MAGEAERHRPGSRGAQRAGSGVADVHVLYLRADLQPAAVEPESVQTRVYDPDRSVVHVREYLTVHDGDVCHDEDLAGEGADGRDGDPRAVSGADLPGAGEREPGDVAAVHLRVRVVCSRHERVLYGHTDNHRCRGRADRDQEKECEVCGGAVSVLCALPAAGGVLHGHKVAARSPCMANRVM